MPNIAYKSKVFVSVTLSPQNNGLSSYLKLSKLLSSLTPSLIEEKYAFSTIKEPIPPIRLEWKALLRENEGLTIVSTHNQAQKHNLKAIYECALITLKVHSDLQAVGITAVVSKALANLNISCNILAGYHHDHIFVPFEHRIEALQMLQHLSESHVE